MKPTQVDDLAITQAIDCGLCEDESADCAGTILETVELAVPFTHPKGNFRYADYVLRVEGGIVVSVGLIHCEYCSDKGYVLVTNACEECEGEGCEVCKFRGGKLTKIRCQDCKKS